MEIKICISSSTKTLLKVGLIPVLLHALAVPAAITVTNIAQGCAASHTLFLKSDGSLWAMGYNYYGQLGDGTYSTNSFYGTNQPEEIVASGVTAIAAGYRHSLFLKSDGSLWAMGVNYYGQLGDGTYSRNDPFDGTNQPEEIVASGVTAIAAGEDHSLFLKSDGSLWAMGLNNSGQLGDGTYSTNFPYGTNQPEEIVTSGVTAIAAGYAHSLFLKSNGSLWATGINLFGQLGDGTFTDTNKPQEIVAGGVTSIAAGGDHSLFLKSDGSLWAMGWNQYGQLGDGTYSRNDPYDGTNQPEEIVFSNVVAIAAGESHSLFLKSDGSLWAMGDNSYGQLGDGTFKNTAQPEEIVTSNVVAIAAGQYHSLFLKSDGSLWVMGDNAYGQLGDGFIDYGNPWGTATLEQVVPKTQLVLTLTLLSKTNLQFSATCGFGGNFFLLANTNLAQPLSQWMPIWTNVITSRYDNIFSATLANAVLSDSPQFYILQSP